MAAAPEMRARVSRVKSFDVEISVVEAGEYPSILWNRLEKVASRFVFQAETGADGFDYYHVRLRRKQRISLAGAIREDRELLFDGRISVTSAGVHFGSRGRCFNYVMTANRRVAGPWTDADMPRPGMTRRLADFLAKDMYPWQEDLEKLLMFGGRSGVLLIHDPVGNTGKTVFSEYLEYKGVVDTLPPFDGDGDLVRFANRSHSQVKGFIIDMPRALAGDGSEALKLYAGIEAFHNYLSVDLRYKVRRVRLDGPQVVVFTCRIPWFVSRNPDRWVVYTVTRDYRLQEVSVFEALGFQQYLDQRQDAEYVLSSGEEMELDELVAPLAADTEESEDLGDDALTAGTDDTIDFRSDDVEVE